MKFARLSLVVLSFGALIAGVILLEFQYGGWKALVKGELSQYTVKQSVADITIGMLLLSLVSPFSGRGGKFAKALAVLVWLALLVLVVLKMAWTTQWTSFRTSFLISNCALISLQLVSLLFITCESPPAPALDDDGTTLSPLLDSEGEEKSGEGASSSSSKGNSHTSLSRVLSLAKPELGILSIATVALFLAAASTMAIPAFFGQLIDVVSRSGSTEQLNRIAEFLILFFVLSSLFAFVRGSLYTLAGERLVARLRKDVFDAIISQEIGFFDITQSGELVNRLASDTNVLQDAITVNISMALRSAAQAIVGLLLLFFVSWQLTLVMLAVVPAVTLGAVAYGKFMKRITTAYQKALADAGSAAEESIGSIRTVRSFSTEPHESTRYAAAIDCSYRAGAKRAWAYGAFIGCIGLLSYAAMVLVLWYGGRLVLQGKMSPGTLTSFLLYTIYIATSLGTLSSLYGKFMSAVGASEKLFLLLDRVPRVPVAGGEVRQDCRGKLTFEDVSFAYPSRPEMPVLDGVSFTLDAGRTMALVGPSGSGKSTVVSLIERFYDPDQGGIFLDGIPLTSLDPTWLHKVVAVVSQEPVLFARSVADNIAYGSDGAHSREDIIRVAKLANAHDFVSRFPDGYDTMVGERGVQLSGGQKQRVAIARAILMDPRLLLLDEATSALDAESEHLVQEALDRLMENRTTVVVAHRLSTVRDADTVLVVAQGKIAERGTHDELLQREGGIYKQLVRRQMNMASREEEAAAGAGLGGTKAVLLPGDDGNDAAAGAGVSLLQGLADAMVGDGSSEPSSSGALQLQQQQQQPGGEDAGEAED